VAVPWTPTSRRTFTSTETATWSPRPRCESKAPPSRTAHSNGVMTVAAADDPDRLLTIDEISDLLQLPVQSIYKQRLLGLFCPAYKIGRHLRWKRDELFTWLETRKDGV
jgi:predicted DNA-binding transcriptional regulator AlpA